MATVSGTLNDIFSVESLRQRGEGPGSESPAALSVPAEVKDSKVDPSAVMSAVIDSLSALLDIRLANILAGAWSKAAVLREYRDKSKNAPAESFVVPMATHTIQSRHKPTVEILVNDKKVQSIPVEIVLRLTLDGLVLKIKNGRVMEIRPGACLASGTVACQGQVLIERKPQPLTLPGVLSLGDGVEIPAVADEGGAAG